MPTGYSIYEAFDAPRPAQKGSSYDHLGAENGLCSNMLAPGENEHCEVLDA